MQMLPSVGLICGLKNSSIQMQSTPQNNYAFLLFAVHLPYYSPICTFFPTRPLQLYLCFFQAILLHSNMNVSHIHTPTLVVSLQQLRLKPSTTPSFGFLASDISLESAIPPSVSGPGLYGHAFRVMLTNTADLPAPNRKKQGWLCPASTREQQIISPLTA